MCLSKFAISLNSWDDKWPEKRPTLYCRCRRVGMFYWDTQAFVVLATLAIHGMQPRLLCGLWF